MLLAISALESIYMVVLAALMTAEELARVTMVLSYANSALTYLALLLLGIGIWMQSRIMRQVLALRHDGEGALK